MFRIFSIAIFVALLLNYTTATRAQTAQQPVSETCRMGECDREYLLSTVSNSDGTITARTRVEFYMAPGTVGKPGPARFFTYTISCRLPAAYIQTINPFVNQTVRFEEPNPHPAHVSLEADTLWAKVCGRPNPQGDAIQQERPKQTAKEVNAQIGPSFDCSSTKQPLAQMICADADLSRLDLLFAQAYWVLLQQLDEAGKRALKQEDVVFINTVQDQCGIPRSGTTPIPTPQERSCVENSYKIQRSVWLARLALPAAEEARRPIEQHIALQQGLQRLGLLPATTKIDGVYGVGTRTAIAQWQQSHDRPATSILGDADAQLLEREANGRGTTEAAGAAQALTTQPETPPGAGLTVTIMPNRAEAALIVKGEIRNEAGAARDVPKLRIAITDANNSELAMKVVNAPVERLDAGASAIFDTTFEPNDRAVGVSVTFVAEVPKSATAQTATDIAASEVSIRAFLQSIYSQYPRPTGRNSPPPPWVMPYAAHIFDKPMIVLLEEEHHLSTGPDGGIVAFDSDPFCDCQDQEGMRSSIGAIRLMGPPAATANVDLRWMCSVTPNAQISPAKREQLLADCQRTHNGGLIEFKQLVFNLVVENNEWRIHDIHSPNIASLRKHISDSIIAARKLPGHINEVSPKARPLTRSTFQGRTIPPKTAPVKDCFAFNGQQYCN